MKDKKLYIALFTISIIFLGIGGTFAFLTVNVNATNITQIKSGNLTMTIDGGGNENVTFFPAKCTSEYAIKKTIKASAVNTSGGKVSFSIGMNITTLSDDFKRTTMKYALTTVENSCTDGLIANGNFNDVEVGSDIWLIKNDYDNITNLNNTYTKTYYLYIWLNRTETENLSGSISVNMKGTSSNNPNLETVANKEKTLLYDTINNNVDTATIIDFSQTSAASNTNGIYMTTDTDSGKPVYYYRGNVDNHLIFANFCWRIVRTTETGGVKLIYDGEIKKNYETTKVLEQSSYINVTNDATYPYKFDDTTKAWISTNKKLVTTGTITFTVDTAGDYFLSYVMSSNTSDRALFYKNDTLLESHVGTETGMIRLMDLTVSDIIKVVYDKGNTSSENNDTVTFSLSKGEGEFTKFCDNTGSNSTIGTSEFNPKINDAKYVGYMYGSSIDDAVNATDSTIKGVIDVWYKDNMTSYTSQLEDTVFCNDRSYTYTTNTTSGSNLNFGAYTRLKANKQPTLKCQNTRDKFTVEESNGNGALTYPVGLITADEVAYAGAVQSKNNKEFYLYISKKIWVLSPFYFRKIYQTKGGAFEYSLEVSGSLYSANLVERVTNKKMVRPVISLKPGTILSSGSGTAADPFIVN